MVVVVVVVPHLRLVQLLSAEEVVVEAVVPGSFELAVILLVVVAVVVEEQAVLRCFHLVQSAVVEQEAELSVEVVVVDMTAAAVELVGSLAAVELVPEASEL